MTRPLVPRPVPRVDTTARSFAELVADQQDRDRDRQDLEHELERADRAREVGDADHPTDLAFCRADGAPVPWRHRGPLSDRSIPDRQAEEAA